MQELVIVNWVAREEVGHFADFRSLLDNASKILEEKGGVNVRNLPFPVGVTNSDRFTKLAAALGSSKTSDTNGIARHVFIDFLHDAEDSLSELDDFLTQRRTTLSCLMDLTSFTADGEITPYGGPLLRTMSAMTSLSAVAVWDERFDGTELFGVPVVSIPDFQPSSTSRPDTCVLCDEENARPILGSAGMLHSYRVLDLLVNVARVNPHQRVVAVGAVPDEARVIVDEGLPDNMTLIEGWLSQSDHMNHYIQHFDALLLDAERYPPPSGILKRARALGVLCLITDGDSYARWRSTWDSGIKSLPRSLLVTENFVQDFLLSQEIRGFLSFPTTVTRESAAVAVADFLEFAMKRKEDGFEI